MIAEIKYIQSPDVFNLESYIPIIKDNFAFLLQVIVGPKDEEGEESFDFFVCTPKWILNRYNGNDIIFPRHYIIILNYDYNNLISTLKSKIETIEEDSWGKIGLILSRIGHWEFEDYRE